MSQRHGRNIEADEQGSKTSVQTQWARAQLKETRRVREPGTDTSYKYFQSERVWPW
jgi:hypothetical protein